MMKRLSIALAAGILCLCSSFVTEESVAISSVEKQLEDMEALYEGRDLEEINDLYYGIIDSLTTSELIPTTRRVFNFYIEECLPELIANSGEDEPEEWLEANLAIADHFYAMAFKYSIAFAATSTDYSEELFDIAFTLILTQICNQYTIRDMLYPKLW